MITFSEHSLKLPGFTDSKPFSGLFEDDRLVASGFESGRNLAKKLDLTGATNIQNASFGDAINQFQAGKDSKFKKFAKTAIKNGTDLQVQAWNFLAELDFGDVITYTELAEGVRRPIAVRSLASACKKNNHILIIGCHRVVKKNGLVGKYAYGPELKTELLQFESDLAN